MTTTKQRNRPPAAGATQADTLAAMQILLAAGIPVLLWGDPGTGKTHTVEAFARRAGWRTVSVIASIHDPTDFAGLPVRTDAGVVFEPPAWARRTAERDGMSLVFFDEVNTATPATQNALMRVVLEGRVGDLELGESVRFAAAANPPSQNSAAWDLSAPLANRFAHLEWPVSFEDWKAGYLGGWPDPDPLDIDLSTIDPYSRGAGQAAAGLVPGHPAGFGVRGASTTAPHCGAGPRRDHGNVSRTVWPSPTPPECQTTCGCWSRPRWWVTAQRPSTWRTYATWTCLTPRTCSPIPPSSANCNALTSNSRRSTRLSPPRPRTPNTGATRSGCASSPQAAEPPTWPRRPRCASLRSSPHL